MAGRTQLATENDASMAMASNCGHAVRARLLNTSAFCNDVNRFNQANPETATDRSEFGASFLDSTI